jgi:hypothetical protein
MNSIVLLKRVLANCRLICVRQGFAKSVIQGKPVDRNGNPCPWYTYASIEYLRQFDFSNKYVFEYGAGYSSLFWAKRAKRVASVESDPVWYEAIRQSLQANQELLLATTKDEYVHSVASLERPFDVIVIDGKWRNACADLSPLHLRDGGMVIFDNSDRYAAACSRIRDAGFFQIDFNGLGPINGYAWTTSIFVRGATELQEGFSPPTPLGGLDQIASDDD